MAPASSRRVTSSHHKRKRRSRKLLQRLKYWRRKLTVTRATVVTVFQVAAAVAKLIEMLKELLNAHKN